MTDLSGLAASPICPILSTVQKQSKHKDDNEYFITMSMEPLSTGCNTHFINLSDGEGAAISNDFTG